MSLRKVNQKFIIVGIVCFFCVMIGFRLSANAQDIKLIGDAFSDPSKKMEMDEDWIKKVIVYEDWGSKADLTVSFDQHLYPALSSIVKNFEKETGLKVAVKEGTCGISYGLLTRKAVDMAAFCCPPNMTDRLPGIEFHTIGIGSLALFVNNENKVDNITLTDAQEIFQGLKVNWSEVKMADGSYGPDLPIRLIGRLHCKQRPGHWCLLLANKDLFSPEISDVGSISDVFLQVSGDISAIGAAETLYKEIIYDEENKVKAIKIDEYDPANAEDLISGKYPFYFTYNVTTWSGENVKNDHAKELLDYIYKHSDEIDPQFYIISTDKLKKAGWKFQGDELVGEKE